MSIRCQSSESPFNQPQHHDVCVTQCCQLLIFSDKKVRGFSKISKIYLLRPFQNTLQLLLWRASHFSKQYNGRKKESIFGNVKVGNTVCVCLRIRRRSAVHPQSIQMERKNNKRGKEALSSLFFCHKMDMGMKVDQSVF